MTASDKPSVINNFGEANPESLTIPQGWICWSFIPTLWWPAKQKQNTVSQTLK